MPNLSASAANVLDPNHEAANGGLTRLVQIRVAGLKMKGTQSTIKELRSLNTALANAQDGAVTMHQALSDQGINPDQFAR